MKKLLLTAMMLISNIMLTHAQDIYYIDIENHPSNMRRCLGDNETFYVRAQDGCNEGYEWVVDGNVIQNQSPIVITPSEHSYAIEYFGCEGFYHFFTIQYVNTTAPETFTQVVWGLPGQGTTFYATIGDGYNTYSWQNGGPNSYSYEVFTPGTYVCEVTNPCGSATQTFIRYDKVELYRATVDLATGLNKVTWPIIPGQEEYISEVKAYRDGMLVGTMPYEQGYFLDNIGSDNAARNYHLVAVTIEGEESPASFQKGTIHTTYYEDVNSNLNMTWNIPYVEEGAQGTLTYFQVCKYDPNTGNLTVVDQVNSLITDYTCSVNQFEGGYPVIAAVFSDAKNRDFEDLSFSNMYTDIAIQPQEITISLEPGWTWFSYPYPVSKTLDEALVGFMPMSGDIIVSQSGGTTSFVNGRWRGALTQFTPGLGYMYYSSRSESAPLVFDLTSSRARVKP